MQNPANQDLPEDISIASPKRPGMMAALRAKLKARPDSEHEMTFNRLIMNGIVVLYALIISSATSDDLTSSMMTLSIYYTAGSVAIFLHILCFPEKSPIRRLAAMVLDISCVTYAIHVGGEWNLWLYPFLLWVIFGNGFRFGVKYLFAASAMSVAGFGFLLVYSTFWHRYPALSWGCMAGLVTLPTYAAVLIQKLEEAKRQAEESNRAKSAFLASISHELRTPLTAIIGLSDLLNSTPMNREQANMNVTIGESGRSLLSLINAILDLSRLEVRMMPKKIQSIDFFRLLHRVRDMIAVSARSKNVDVTLNFAPDVPRFILTSLKHIEDSIVNLASNAVKFTNSGFVLISVSITEKKLDTVRLRIEVTDSGIGIAKDAQERIFERFTQADESIIDKFGGTGLGLATVKQMIEDIDGQVGVRSKPGHGSTFWIELDAGAGMEDGLRDWRPVDVIAITNDMNLLQKFDEIGINVHQSKDIRTAIQKSGALRAEDIAPLIFVDARVTGADLDAVSRDIRGDSHACRPSLIAITDDAPDRNFQITPENFVTTLHRPLLLEDLAASLIMAAGPAPESGADSRFDKRAPLMTYSILLADDNKVNRTVISKILTHAGHTVEAVENGRLAIEALQEKVFDIALFDINMPVINGVEAAKIYHFISNGSDKTPIVALTADATPEAEARCEDAGMAACLVKPIEAKILLEHIDRIVAANGGARSAMIESAAMQESNASLDTKDVSPGATNLETPGVIDIRAVNDLYELGGTQFVQEVIEHFIEEANDVLKQLDRAVEDLDYKAFRDQVHALRSGAANVGATRVFKLCLAWRSIEPEELASHGDRYVREIAEVIVESRQQLAVLCLKYGVTSDAPAGADLPRAPVTGKRRGAI